MSKPKRMVADMPQQAEKPPAKAVESCSANGCPLPGTIRPENGDPVCGVHFLADKHGWPKATAVILEHQTLHGMAKRAQSVGTPMSISAQSAALLFESAKAHGLEFNDAQRETYRRAAMKLTVAGALVEAAICAAAVSAAIVKQKQGEPSKIEEESESFNSLLRGLMNNIRMAA